MVLAGCLNSQQCIYWALRKRLLHAQHWVPELRWAAGQTQPWAFHLQSQPLRQNRLGVTSDTSGKTSENKDTEAFYWRPRAHTVNESHSCPAAPKCKGPPQNSPK